MSSFTLLLLFDYFKEWFFINATIMDDVLSQHCVELTLIFTILQTILNVSKTNAFIDEIALCLRKATRVKTVRAQSKLRFSKTTKCMDN